MFFSKKTSQTSYPILKSRSKSTSTFTEHFQIRIFQSRKRPANQMRANRVHPNEQFALSIGDSRTHVEKGLSTFCFSRVFKEILGILIYLVSGYQKPLKSDQVIRFSGREASPRSSLLRSVDIPRVPDFAAIAPEPSFSDSMQFLVLNGMFMSLFSKKADTWCRPSCDEISRVGDDLLSIILILWTQGSCRGQQKYTFVNMLHM